MLMYAHVCADSFTEACKLAAIKEVQYLGRVDSSS